MSKTNKTTYAILGMLSIEPMSGYDIRQMMQQSTSNFWAESDGQLYPALTKLTTQGLIVCKSSKETAARKKKTYSITAKGMTELKKWLMKEPEAQSVRNEAMLQLFFGANVAPEITQEQLQTHRHKARLRLSQLTEAEKQLKQEHKNSQHLPYWLMSIEYGICITEAKLQWYDNTIKTLVKLKTKR